MLFIPYLAKSLTVRSFNVTSVVVVGRNFKDDPDCAKHLPIANDGANLYEKCKDGILLWSVERHVQRHLLSNAIDFIAANPRTYLFK